MGHALEQFTDGTASFYAARQPGWHALGTVTDTAKTADEAIRLAQMDWLVEKAPLHATVITDDGVTTLAVPDKFATVRKHPKRDQIDVLGVVGSQYHIVQNIEAFDVLNAIADESGAVFETAGSLHGGKSVFVTMKMPDGLVFADGQENVDLYLLATNDHTGARSFVLAVTPMRVVCQNTLTMGLRQAHRTFSIRHTVNATRRIAEARDALGLTFRYVEAFQQEVEALLATPYTDKQFAAYVKRLVPDPKEGTTVRAANTVDKARTALHDLWKSPTQQITPNTAWAAWNTAVEYADWIRPVRGGDGASAGSATARAQRTLSAANDAWKGKALALLTR